MASEALGNMITNTIDKGSNIAGDQNQELGIKILPARVVKGGSITDQDSDFYKDISSLRGIQFESLVDFNNGRTTSGTAQSLFPHITSPPLEGEIVFIIVNGSNRGNFDFFYISSLNLYNNGTYNPDVPKFNLDKDDNIPMGKGITETNLDKLRKLLLSPGDTSLEGRFGNTIRLGNSNKLKINKENIDTPYKGEENSPIIIIRNGQKETDSLDPLFEDINKDNSSIYLTKGQTIPIDVISTNMQTFKIEGVKTTNSDNTLTFNLNPGNINENDISAVIADNTPLPDESREYNEGDHDYEENVPKSEQIDNENKESDQVFIPIGSPEQISGESTSDPTFSDSGGSAGNSTLVEIYKGYEIKKRIATTDFGERYTELFINSTEEDLVPAVVNIDITGESNALESLKFTIDIKLEP